MVDALDSKSCEPCSWEFKSPRPYQFFEVVSMQPISEEENRYLSLMEKHSDRKDVVLICCNNLSILYYNAGRLDEARRYADEALKLDAHHPAAHINSGNLFYVNKDYQRALDCYLKADAVKENYAIAKINLANTYLELKDFHLAVDYACTVIALEPDNSMAHVILANAQLELSKNDKAIESLSKAAKLDTKNPWIYNSLSQAYQNKNDVANALMYAWKAVELSPDNDAHHINFGYLIYELNLLFEEKNNEILEYAKKWVEKFPENGIAKHMSDALLGNLSDEKNNRANAFYVSGIFDVFAEHFDSVLKGLDYRVPEFIESFMKEFYTKNTQLKILDIGCGTGLCGAFLKDYAALLEGVDLSEKMLQQASEKNFYHQLHRADLEDFLSAKTQNYNLIISADVFTYFGDLSAAFTAAGKSLKPNGRMIFSFSEYAESDEKGFLLHASGRFLHSRKYVENCLNSAGFSVEKMEPKTLRMENDKPVLGYIVSARV